MMIRLFGEIIADDAMRLSETADVKNMTWS